jgi:SulP family sulfate permease
MSAIVAMESIANDLSARNIGLIINNLQPRMILKLRRAGIRKRIGKVAFSRSLEDGFAAARKMLQP